MKELEKKIIEWCGKNFDRTNKVDPVLGVSEEAGELSHHFLKNKQGIRINENHIAGMKDAVGDIAIYLIDFCERMGWSFSDVVEETAEHVMKRDWNKNKETGV